MPGARLAWNLARSCLVLSAEIPFTSNPTFFSQEFRLAWPRVSAKTRNS